MIVPDMPRTLSRAPAVQQQLAVLLGAVTRRLVYAARCPVPGARCPVMVVRRTRDAAPAVSLIGGIEAAIDT
jgi:hypothetical protein